MTTEATLPAQGAAQEPQKAQEPALPAGDDVLEQQWDPMRAAKTILKQRDEVIQLKEKLQAQQSVVDEYEKLKAEEQKRKDAELSEVERLKKQADELTKAKADLELSIMRRDVISETGLPAVFADRLKGATKEEMLADAETLKKSLPQIKQPGQTVTNPGNASQTETEAQMRERLFGKPARIFDINEIKKGGGGVVFNSKE